MTLSVIPDVSLAVILSATAKLIFDQPVTIEEIEGIRQLVLRFPSGTQSLQFRLRDEPDLEIPFGVPITITATLGENTLTATITITQ